MRDIDLIFEAPPNFDKKIFNLPGYTPKFEAGESSVPADPGNQIYHATLVLQKGCAWLTQGEIEYIVGIWNTSGIQVHALDAMNDPPLPMQKH